MRRWIIEITSPNQSTIDYMTEDGEIKFYKAKSGATTIVNYMKKDDARSKIKPTRVITIREVDVSYTWTYV